MQRGTHALVEASAYVTTTRSCVDHTGNVLWLSWTLGVPDCLSYFGFWKVWYQIAPGWVMTGLSPFWHCHNTPYFEPSVRIPLPRLKWCSWMTVTRSVQDLAPGGWGVTILKGLGWTCSTWDRKGWASLFNLCFSSGHGTSDAELRAKGFQIPLVEGRVWLG